MMSDDSFRRADNTAAAASTEGVVETDGGGSLAVDSRTGRIIRDYGSDIKRTATRYGFDWRLVLAVIKQESRFSAQAQSPAGARGLMQIMPGTGLEVSRQLEIADIHHPEKNIHGGVYYLKRLYDRFDGADDADRLKLALAAYNAGYSRILDAQEIAEYVRDNPNTWRAVKDALPLLSQRNSALHGSVWKKDRPRAGWFRRPEETITYVENVMAYYDEYRLLLN